jgi:hypothetical protein
LGRRKRRHPRKYSRRALLELLAGAGAAGCDTSALLALGFGIAAPSAQRVANGARELDLSRLRITEAGRAAQGALARR